MHQIPQKGRPEQDIFKDMEQYRSEDPNWRSGKVWSYVYHAGDEAEALVKKAYNMFLSENGLDPTVFKSLQRFENDVVKSVINLVGGDDKVVGNLTSGGTESLLMAVKTARDWAREHKPHIKNPEMIVPITAHSSLFKAAHYFGLKAVMVDVQDDYTVSAETVRKAINPDTILIAASAPSYAHGVMDPIEELGKVALENNLLFHVDGCIGAFILPYIRRLGYHVPPFSFDVPGVTSLSLDLHKYGYAAKGCSVIMHKNKELRKFQLFSCTEWAGYAVVNTTALSSKSGGPIAAAWALLNYIGDEGYLQLAKDTMDARQIIIQAINEIPELKIEGNPVMPLLGISSTKIDIYELNDELKKKGWVIGAQLKKRNMPATIHLTINKINVPHVHALIEDIKEAVKELSKFKFGSIKEKATITATKLLANNLDTDTFEKVTKMLGMDDGALPDKMSTLNKLMEVLPNDFVKKMVVDFMNDLYTVKE
jgi:sphinganine-1-phosphate aldolase